MIISFHLCLLIYGYKSIYSNNDYLLELLFLKVIFSEKREFCVFLGVSFIGMLF